ncbi:MAG: hypothetical protein A2754_04165 [Candidatus Magasanikbacteria bacterium RIFCSPHIGHO2_01_FULL_47_8]|uniref:Phosphoribosyltransferase domain-containing protein n=1 Tax=Candidatus Magasanikbacteria bacterium RIFCSPHIGHO2_01_FULL_47_8 TaxID=1798673 RepID=A0A1F6MC93_9BACT|nr:MAG: hypothetical protein A2754_04165 [Candidatus Magasanikbacteria bacterium RIFCSPHIGHO2_01_FULL_47_8]
MNLQKSLALMKDVLFPIFCVECHKEGEWWCENCRAKQVIPLIQTQLNLSSNLNLITALFPYQEGEIIAKLIHEFKYRYVRDLASLWRAILAKSNFQTSAILIVPVPLHSRRERDRGFNQAKIIADLLGDFLGIPVESKSLVRVRSTDQQAKLSKVAREENVRQAFAWQGASPPRLVLIVDDVYTTGATMQECARVLKEVGVSQVEGFVLGKAV